MMSNASVFLFNVTESVSTTNNSNGTSVLGSHTFHVSKSDLDFRHVVNSMDFCIIPILCLIGKLKT